MTLYRWDLPQGFEDAGGWPERAPAHRFADRAALVHDSLGDRVNLWTTVHEPWCSSMLGYAWAMHAPGRADHQPATGPPRCQLLLPHACGGCEVGRPGHGAPPGSGGIEVLPTRGPFTQMGWEVLPQGLTDLLVRLQQVYDVLIVVTENGAAYPDVVEPTALVRDDRRIACLESHLGTMKDVIGRGVDPRGYFAWSLLDNCEWGHGCSKRFGLIHVDYGVCERRPKGKCQLLLLGGTQQRASMTRQRGFRGEDECGE